MSSVNPGEPSKAIAPTVLVDLNWKPAPRFVVDALAVGSQ